MKENVTQSLQRGESDFEINECCAGERGRGQDREESRAAFSTLDRGPSPVAVLACGC